VLDHLSQLGGILGAKTGARRGSSGAGYEGAAAEEGKKQFGEVHSGMGLVKVLMGGDWGWFKLAVFL
jgi:hypothetical protein